jgi:hypothetical protein
MPEPVEPSEPPDHDERWRRAKFASSVLAPPLAAAAAVAVPGAAAALLVAAFPLPPLPLPPPLPLLLVDRVIIGDRCSSLEEPPEVISRTDDADSIDAESLPDESPFRSGSSSEMGFVVAAASLVLRSLEEEACCRCCRACCCCCCCCCEESAATAASARSLAWPAALARHCAQASSDLQTGGKSAGL